MIKKILFAVCFMTLFSSCVVVNNIKEKRFRYQSLYPGKAALHGKSPCNIYPKPIWKR